MTDIIKLARSYGDVTGGGPIELSINFTEEGLRDFVRAQADSQAPVATVRVTAEGYAMELSTYIAYALPEGKHDLYAAPQPAIAPSVALQVWYGPMPESNGKTNWTAILHRGDVTQGITIDHDEYPDRVRYEADRMRWMIGEIADEPDILSYDADKHSGYIAPSVEHRGGDAEWHALRKGNDDAIERCAWLMINRYQNVTMALHMTRGMADGERAKNLNAELTGSPPVAE